MGVTHLAIWLHVEYNGKIANFHRMSIPISKRHIAKNIYEYFATCMDTLLPEGEWNKRLLGCCTDGARTMLGNSEGFAIWLERVVPPGYIRTWCGLHRVDLAVKNELEKAHWTG